MSKSLSDLQKELSMVSGKFEGLFDIVHFDTPFDHPFEAGGLLDGHSDGVSYPKLKYGVNPKDAVYLWNRIEALKEQITSFMWIKNVKLWIRKEENKMMKILEEN